MDSTKENKDTWATVCLINCLSLEYNPTNKHSYIIELLKRASSNIYFHQVNLDDVALLGTDLQGKDLKEELDLGLDPLGRVVGPPTARCPER